MTDPRPLVELREEIARLVEPDAWKWLDRGKYLEAHQPIADEALAKSDKIIALIEGEKT